MLELVLGSVYHSVMGPTTGPDVTIFQKFQRMWKNFDMDAYGVPLISDLPPFLRSRVTEIVSFAENNILVSI